MSALDETAALLLAAADRIAAALQIHRPCHTADRDCERGHYGEPSYPLADQPAECIGCGYDNHDMPHPYPCPTAHALGVPPALPREDPS